MDLTHISEGNEKTACFSFDLPAIETCPGKSSICAAKCYAAKLMKVYPSTGDKYRRNFEFAAAANFVTYMVKNIPQRCDFRIHVSGDFFSIEYVARWIQIVKARPDVRFYAYTRSWRVPAIWAMIQQLAQLPNINVNLSVDAETGAPSAENYRWCFLTDNDSAPVWMRKGDIVFRTNHSGKTGHHQWKRKNALVKGLDPNAVAPLLHKIAGATVCPMERGTKMPENFSCAKCALCIKKPQTEMVTA